MKDLINFTKKYWKLLLTLVYILSPIDIIPDPIPFFGFTDDLLVLVVTFVLNYLSKAQIKKEPLDFNEPDNLHFQNGPLVEGEIIEKE